MFEKNDFAAIMKLWFRYFGWNWYWLLRAWNEAENPFYSLTFEVQLFHTDACFNIIHLDNHNKASGDIIQL